MSSGGGNDGRRVMGIVSLDRTQPDFLYAAKLLQFLVLTIDEANLSIRMMNCLK